MRNIELHTQCSMKKSEIIFGLLRLPVDLAMIALAFFSAYSLRQNDDIIPTLFKSADLSLFPDPMTYTTLVTQFGIAFILLLTVYASYSFKVYNTYSREAKTIFIAWFTWIGIILLYYFLIREFPFSRLVIVLGWALSLTYVLLGRSIVKILQLIALNLGIGVRRVMFIGTTTHHEKILNHLRKQKQYNIVGIIANEKIKSLSEYRHLGDISELRSIIKKNRIEEIVQLENMGTNTFDIISACRELHVQYHFIPDQVGVQTSRIDIQLLGDYPLVSVRTTPLDGWGKIVKRIFDIGFAIFILILTSPILLLTALAIKLDTRGPVLFTKLDDGKSVVRIGEKGRPFKFLKFRSMHDKTHSLRYTTLASKNKRNGPVFKIDNDPRVTRVGRFIRKFDIDELPQFWNVIRGEMSVVGPRPHLPEEVDNYDPHHRFALSIKPGITGLAQVNGRSRIDFETESKLDTYYIENWSLWLDIKICMQTIMTIVRGRGE